MDWISVEDELPEDLTTVLIYTSGSGVLVGFYNKRYNHWITDVIDIRATYDTYWQPLPDPPE